MKPKNKFLRVFSSIFLIVLVFCAQGAVQSDQLLVRSITLDNGLPNNKVNSIVKDKYGFMWFGTNDGVCRYDGFQLRFYALDDFKGGSSRTPQISSLKTDTLGNLLIGSYTLFYYDYGIDQIKPINALSEQGDLQELGRIHTIEVGTGGLFYIGAENGLFTYNPATKQMASISTQFSNNNYILSLFSDGNQLWIGTKQAMLYRYLIDQKLVSLVTAFHLPAIQSNQILCFYKSRENSLWMGTQNSGLIELSLNDSSLVVRLPDTANSFTSRVRKITEDNNGNIWLGTRGGLYQYFAGKFICKAHQGHPTSNLTSSSIYDIYIDDHSTMWLGTYSGGVNYIYLNRKPFDIEKPVQYISANEKSNINCFAEDMHQNLWIGTENNGLIYKCKKTGKYEFFGANNKNLSNSIKSIAVDRDANVWVGTYSGLSYINMNTKQIVNFNTGNSTLSSNQIRSIKIDVANNIWIGTNQGLNSFNWKDKTFSTIFSELEIHPVYIDHQQSIWFGTSPEGIFRKKVDQANFENVYRQYFNSFIRCILVDSQNNLWIGNNKGLYFVNQKTDSLLSFGITEGLPTLRIDGLIEDNEQNLWISTDAGLLKGNLAISNPAKTSFNKFSISDGLQGQLFRINAYLKSSSGELFFGGDIGYNKFYPEHIKSDYNAPKIAFTDFKIFNKSVVIGQELDGYQVLPKAINELQTINLSYKHRLFTIDFAALHYTNPANNQYRYRLLPLQKDWVYSTGLRNFASYSNLKGGNYTFELEAANSDAIWNQNTRKLAIKVHPPFWATTWFVLCVVVFVCCLIVSLYLNRISRLKRYSIELENKVALRTKELKDSLDELIVKQQLIEIQTITLNQQKEQLLELNSTKDKFFTIIAHDLKNPFHSILGMTELLENKLKNDAATETQVFVKVILDSTKHLYRLLENLLTWARTQTNRIAFRTELLKVSDLIYQSLILFEKNILVKKIEVDFEIVSEQTVYADRNMLDAVIRNLLSNAIKYTYTDGRIKIILQQQEKDMLFSISDNGIGIRTNQLGRIFQIDENKSRPGTEGEKGTGLGLLLCKEFITKHKGRIWVESELKKGSTFFFTIPLEQEKGEN